MAEHLAGIVAEHDDWLDGWERLCGDYGVSFSRSKREHVPIPEHKRFEPKRFGMVVALPLEERLEKARS